MKGTRLVEGPIVEEVDLSSDALIGKLSDAFWRNWQDTVSLPLELCNVEQSTSAKLENFTSAELKLLEPFSAEDLERW